MFNYKIFIMKHLKTIFACLLMAVLSIGQVWAVESNFTDKNLSVGEGELTWTASPAFSSFDTQNGRGPQSAKASTEITMTSAEITGTITSVVVTASTNGTSALSISIDGNAFGGDAQTITSGTAAKNSPYEFTGSATVSAKPVIVSITRTNCTVWIKSITVTYTTGGGGGSDPTLSLDPQSKEFETTGNSAQTIALTASNFSSDISSVTCAFYSEATCATSISRPSWVNEPTVNDTKTQVSVNVSDNDGAARQTWMKITASDGSDEASAVFAISQKALVVDFATLPFAFDGGKADIETTNGMTQGSLDNSDYSASPKLKFKNQGSWVIIKINADPGTLTYDIKGNSMSGTYAFDVEQSTDGETYSNVTTHTSLSGSKESKEFTLNQTTRFVRFVYTTKASGNVGLGNIAISEYVAPAAVATPVISGDDPFLTETEVSITCETAGATIYYTTTESAKGTPATSGDWIAYDSENKPSFNATTTVWAAAIKGSDWSSVAEKTFTKTTALTTMDEIFAAATTTATPQFITFSSSWVVTGVSTNGKNVYITDGTKGMILYNNGANMGLVVGNTLSGTVQRSLKLYNGSAQLDAFTPEGLTIGTGSQPAVQELDATGIEALSGANTGSLIKISGECSEESGKFKIGGVQLYNSLYSFSVSAGTSYECTGVYVQYNTNTANTKEILPRSAADIVETSTIAVTGVTLTESTASVEAGETVTLHATVDPSTATNKTIVWSVQSGDDKASVDENGVVTGIEAGTAVIRAASVENASIYAECTVTVTAADPTKHKVTFDATIDKTTENTELSITKSNVTIAITTGDGRFNNETDYRIYKNAVFTVSCSAGNITKLEFTCNSGNPLSGFADADGLDKDNNVWTGNAESVSFTASNKQVQITQLVVTYKEDTRAESGLAWDPADDIEITVGDLFTAPTLLNPNSIAAAEISIESSNTDLATVTAGVVALVADATGTTTITATFAGNETYKPATVSYSITVNAAAPVLTDYYEKVTSGDVAEGTYLIVYETGNVAFNGGAETLDASGNTIAVAITSDHKIGVTTETEAATFYIDPTAGSIQAANGKYIGQGSDANGMAVSDNALVNTLSIDGDGNAVVVSAGGAYLRYNSNSGQERFRYFKSSSYTGQKAIQLYKLHGEVIKPASGLAWDPADDIEITVGGAFTAPTLSNPNSIPAEEITIESSNTDLATVTAGVVELVADATGSATITATYTGTTYKPITVSYKIKVNPAHSIYVDKLNVNFGSVEKDAVVADKTIAITLTAVDAATATLAGDGASAFSIDPAVLTASGSITISASSATVGTYAATITISDDAGNAESKVVNLSFAVTEPAAEETPVSTTSKWVPATEITDGMQVLITGVKSEVVYAMGEQKSNNRTAVAGTLSEGVFTPGEKTMAFTLVATGAPDTYYLKTSNNQYLYNASTSGNSYLRTKAEQENVSWTITFDGDGNAVITSVENTNRQLMRFNLNGTSNPLFNCYASGQNAIKLYVPQTPEPPVVDYTEVRNGLTAGWYYTMCLDKAVTAVQGGSIWRVLSKAANGNDVILEEVIGTLDAGRPYIFFATANTLQVAYTGDAVGAPVTEGNNGLVGSFTEEPLAQNSNHYIIYNNALYYVNSDNVKVGEHRAYLDMTGVPAYNGAAPAPGRRRVTMAAHGPQTATGIEDLNASEKPMKMMINGQIFILRGEKMYDTTGRLVK